MLNSKITSMQEVFLVRKQTTGTSYITERLNRTKGDGKYRWVKNKNDAVTLSYDAAQKVRQRYGGNLVKITSIIVEESI